DITKAYIQMHLSILLWGATAVLGRGIDMSEGMLVWYRLIITTLSLGAYIYFTKKSFSVSRPMFWKLFGIGALLMVHWLFFYGAIKYSNVSMTLSVFSSTTLFTALIEPLVTKKKFNRMELVYSLMAMAGIGIIYYTDKNSYTVGIILALLAAFLGAFFNILNKDVVGKVSSEVVSFYEILSGLLVLTLILPAYIGYFQPAKLFPSDTDWVLLTVLAVACTHITLILSLNALKHLSAFTLNLSINLEPVYGIALAFVIFHENESLNTEFFVGTAIIMLSVVLHSWFASREKSEPVAVIQE
ncbi:MAG TPA: DMT family transporter, partial [Chitinophagales bacterium]|nr:DMT family transporter [Chitinophagales bacterium]